MAPVSFVGQDSANIASMGRSPAGYRIWASLVHVVVSVRLRVPANASRLSVVEMLSHVKAVGAFVLASQKATKSNCEALRKSQLQHLMASINAMRPSMEDGQATLEALAGELPPWTADETQALASLVSKATQEAENSPAVAVQDRPSSQSMLHMQNYLTEADWVELAKAGATMAHRMSTIVERCFGIGVLYPCEKSVVALVSLIVLASGDRLSSGAFLKNVQEFKKLMKAKRLAAKGLKATMRNFPYAVKDFMSLYPGRYDDTEPPVASRFSASVIDEVRLSMPARNARRSLGARRGPAEQPCERQPHGRRHERLHGRLAANVNAGSGPSCL